MTEQPDFVASCGKCGEYFAFGTSKERSAWLCEHDPNHHDFVSFTASLEDDPKAKANADGRWDPRGCPLKQHDAADDTTRIERESRPLCITPNTTLHIH